ncbi:MAG: ribose-5-phosphate isomerase A [archaeon]
MNIPIIVEKFNKLVANKNIVSIGSSNYDKEIISEFTNILKLENKQVFFVPTTASQAKQLHEKGEEIISLSEKEIDIALEFASQVDSDNNFVKTETKSFIRDKMIGQSALNLVIVVDKTGVVDKITRDLYLEISTFAWQRTIINLQSYGNSRIVLDLNNNFVKTEIGHYLARVTLDEHISLEDFEYSIRNIPGVLETGVFLGLADTIFVIDSSDKNYLEIKSRK